MHTKLILLLVIIVVAVGAGIFFYQRRPANQIMDFASCAEKYPVQLSYPATCTTPEGKSFTNPDQTAPEAP